MRLAKRVYSPSSLEYWFGKLAASWESHFTGKELAQGRRLYLDSGIREIELSATEAIVHCKLDNQTCYAVIEWEHGRLQVRSSLEESFPGRCIAVAGLYEIEELIAEEAAEVPPDKERSEHDDGSNPDSAEPAPEPVPDQTAPVWTLLLSFTVTRGTLEFASYWLNEQGERFAALGKDALNGDHLSQSDREPLVRLASYARRSEFRFDAVRGVYRLMDVESIPSFVRVQWKRWKEHFKVEKDASVDVLFKGEQEAEITIHAESTSDGTLGLAWELRLGDTSLNLQDTRSLIHAGEGLSLLPGKGLCRLSGKQVRLLKEWHEQLDEQLTCQTHPYMLFSLFGVKEAKFQLDERLIQWRQSFYDVPETLALAQPKHVSLRDYQGRGVAWLGHLASRGAHALLADEMGLGKTLQVLTLLASEPLEELPSLIVCPASVVPVWQSEASRFFPHMKLRQLRKGEDFSTSQPGELWVASYSQLRRHKPLLTDMEFGYAVLDEAQSIKNPDAKVTQTCLSIRARRRIALTGTPLENRLLDVWTIFRFLMPGLLGPRRIFENALADSPDEIAARLRSQITPFVLRRTKKDVLKELPDKVMMDLICPMSDLQKAEYRKLTDSARQEFGEQLQTLEHTQQMSFFALLTRLRQASCDPGLLPGQACGVEHSGKLKVLSERLEELVAGGHKIVIFSQFVTFLERVKKLLQEKYPDLPRYELTGKTRERGRPVEQFQKQKGAGIILVSLKAGGTGVTLHAADYVFLLDPWWNPAVEAQAIDRVHRLGQKSKVFVYRLIASGTIEERIQALKQHKRGLFDRTVGELEDVSDLTNYYRSLTDLIELQDSTRSDDSRLV